MLRQSDFFPEEKLASVLNADRGFLATQKELDDYKSLFERSEKWLNVVGK